VPRILYLHAGFPKTATTHLQDRVFPCLSHLHYRPKPADPTLYDDTVDDDGYRRDVLALSFWRDPGVWASFGDRVLASALGDDDGDRDVLLSAEGVVVQNGPAAAAAHYRGFAAAARRAKFDAIRVFLSVRRQDQHLGSDYAQRSDRIRGASQSDFERHVQRTLNPGSDYYYGPGVRYEYAGQHRALRDEFGDDAILVLPVERLAAEPEAYYADLFDFLGASEADHRAALDAMGGPRPRSNARSVGDDTWALRPLRRTRRTAPSPLGRIVQGVRRRLGVPYAPRDPGRGESVTMTGPLRAAVLARYEDENRALAEATGLDLARYGYFSE